MKTGLRTLSTVLGVFVLMGAVLLGQFWQNEYELRRADLMREMSASSNSPLLSEMPDEPPGAPDEAVSRQALTDGDAFMAAKAAADLQMAFVSDLSGSYADQLSLYSDDRAFQWVWYVWDASVSAAWDSFVWEDDSVLWLCSSADGRILAYARAVYQDGKFVSFETHVTLDGARLVPYEGSSGSSFDEQSFLDSVASLAAGEG